MRPHRSAAPIAMALAIALAAPAVVLAQGEAPLTLTLAIANSQGEPSQPAIDTFIEQVATLSNGSMAIEPLYGAGNATEEGFEHGVAVLVERGDADLGLNASRAWDLAGVTSLQALQAPFLISDGALAAAVAEGDIAERALAGMADSGVVGLSLWPEDLRHPFALGDHSPFLSPADFSGATILVQPSALSRALVTGMGGILYIDGDREADAAAGRLHGAESGLLQGHTLPGQPTATGDVTFYPKFQVISANAEAFASLTPEQQETLRLAAFETRDLAIEARTSEADAAAAWCGAGGIIVLAGEDSVAAFEAAAQPVFDQIGQDPLTAELIADIRMLKDVIEPAPSAAACGPAVPPPAAVLSQAYPYSIILPEGWTVAALASPGSGGEDFFGSADGDVVLTMGSGIPEPGQTVADRVALGRAGDYAGCDTDPAQDRPIEMGGEQGILWSATCGSTYHLAAQTIHEGVGYRLTAHLETTDTELAASILDEILAGFIFTEAPAPVPSPAEAIPSPSSAASPGAEASPLEFVWESAGGPQALVMPIDVTLDPEGNLWIPDSAADRFQILDPAGAFLEAWGSSGEGDGQFRFDVSGNVGGDVAFDGEGNIYVADIGNRRVQVFDSHRTFVTSWGGFGADDGQFIQPFSVAVDGDGNVYVSDYGRADVQKFEGDGTFLLEFGGPGTADGQLNNQGGVSVDATGYVWVADCGNARVQKFAADGTFLEAMGGAAAADGGLGCPSNVAVDESGRVFVAETGSHRLVVFDTNGQVSADWGGQGSDPGQFRDPTGVAVDGEGNVYVADIGNGRVQKFRVLPPLAPAHGGAGEVLELVDTWDGDVIPGLSHPGGMDIAPDGSLYVANTGANEILVLDASGHVLRRWGEAGSGDGQLNFLRDANDPNSAIGGVAVTSDGSIYVADAANRRVQQFDAEGGFVRQWGSYDFGTEPGKFIDPIDVADAPDGTVYVVDDQRDDIQHFGADGTWIETIGEHGTGDGQLNFTGAIFVDAAGNLYNADWDNDRVQAWGPDSTFLWSLGSAGTEPGQLQIPGDVGVDEAGNIYVADRHRVQVFGPDRTLIGVWTAPGTTEQDELYAISVGADGLVYVGAPFSDRIYVLRAGDAIRSAAAPTTQAASTTPVEFLWSATGGADGLDFPGSMALDPEGRLWVADTGNDRFAIFTSDGAFVEYWGAPGGGDGQFSLQRSNGDGYGAIAFAPDGSFYVLDVGNHRVQHFDAERQFIGTWGEFGTDPGQYSDPVGLAIDAQSVVHVLDDLRDVVETYDQDGNVLGSFTTNLAGFNSANGLALDAQGNVYISACCEAGNQVEKFDPAGTPIASIGTPGSGPGQFADQPLGMAIDDAGRLFVAQGPVGGLDVQVFDADGQYLTRWVSAESGASESTFPWGIVLDGQGNAYVSGATYEAAEAGANRVVKVRLLPPLSPQSP